MSQFGSELRKTPIKTLLVTSMFTAVTVITRFGIKVFIVKCLLVVTLLATYVHNATVALLNCQQDFA